MRRRQLLTLRNEWLSIQTLFLENLRIGIRMQRHVLMQLFQTNKTITSTNLPRLQSLPQIEFRSLVFLVSPDARFYHLPK